MASKAFNNYIKGVVSSWLPARAIVKSAFQMTGDTLADGTRIPDRVLVLRPNCPWKEHLFEMEEQSSFPEAQKTLYVVYEDTNEKTWRIQTVPVSLNAFESRKPLPEAWRGLRDAELDAASGLQGCTFVHRAGFIGGNITFEGVIAMARLALNA